MTVSSKRCAELVAAGNNNEERGVGIIPPPDVDSLENSGEVAIPLRLGRWFLSFKQTSETTLDALRSSAENSDSKITKQHFVPFGQPFVIHPGRFILGATLEWIKLPLGVSGYVAGKSTWGRRGIIIETAAGVHPGFSGCLTLEIANLGEIPFRLRPGMEICQLFLHDVLDDADQMPPKMPMAGGVASKTHLAGKRRPSLGNPRLDSILERLS